MTVETGPHTRDPLIQTFGVVLRGYREAAGLSRPQLADALGCTPAWIEKMETGTKPSLASAMDLDTYFKIPTKPFQKIAEEIERMGKRLAFPPGFPGFVEQEARATAIYGFESQLITGLLQKEAYARAIMDAGQVPEELDALVAARLSRQAILEKAKPPRIWFVIDESALYRPAGGRGALREQLAYLAHVMIHSPGIQVRILPYDSVTWASLDGSFQILELPDGHKAAYLESPGSGQLIHEPSMVEATLVRFHLVMGEALPASASLKLVTRVLESYE
ncbi:helix-turn-helix domain-containing protein [Actinomadura chibensis]|uniref:Helix-turn-helix domain-containing protein n=1 Tax=Actinomadura chibensis TaxID=392828 RepID=A0A5D0NW87_9ACTN|nr:helix-turn-helix transcriptional regulator [Actinomadura chibensis]TYB48434.1 helix-turn-helix domain-containing protein [Actinomadura chibensis]